ncbi:hypothetical protein EOM09_08000, partial [bacterium]|nr:hypothetical protein [bacterium]
MQLRIDQFSAERSKEIVSAHLQEIQMELDEHLDSINQNSLEIQSNYDFLEQLDKKIEKLHARIDEITQVLSRDKPAPRMEYTPIEKTVFTVLCSANDPLS